MTRTTLSPSREPSLSPAKDEESPSGIDEKERNDIIRMIFDLPRGVQIYEDIIPMHGRMYPTAESVCFYSNLFSSERKIIIPYESISSLSLTRIMFQQALLIQTLDRDYYFTSFWGDARNTCFELIQEKCPNVKLQHSDPGSMATDTDGVKKEVLDVDIDRGEDLIPMKHIVSVDFDLSMDAFMKTFFDNEASFSFPDFLQRTGAYEMECEAWVEDEASGKSRTLQFRIPTDAPIGPRTSRVDTLQRIHTISPNVNCIIETSTKLEDVPYGDHFSVEDRWSVTSAHANDARCNLRIELLVIFSKSTIWKGQIKSRAMVECEKKFKNWIQQAKEFLAPVVLPALARSSSANLAKPMNSKVVVSDGRLETGKGLSKRNRKQRDKIHIMIFVLLIMNVYLIYTTHCMKERISANTAELEHIQELRHSRTCTRHPEGKLLFIPNSSKKEIVIYMTRPDDQQLDHHLVHVTIGIHCLLYITFDGKTTSLVLDTAQLDEHYLEQSRKNQKKVNQTRFQIRANHQVKFTPSEEQKLRGCSLIHADCVEEIAWGRTCIFLVFYHELERTYFLYALETLEDETSGEVIYGLRAMKQFQNPAENQGIPKIHLVDGPLICMAGGNMCGYFQDSPFESQERRIPFETAGKCIVDVKLIESSNVMVGLLDEHQPNAAIEWKSYSYPLCESTDESTFPTTLTEPEDRIESWCWPSTNVSHVYCAYYDYNRPGSVRNNNTRLFISTYAKELIEYRNGISIASTRLAFRCQSMQYSSLGTGATDVLILHSSLEDKVQIVSTCGLFECFYELHHVGLCFAGPFVSSQIQDNVLLLCSQKNKQRDLSLDDKIQLHQIIVDSKIILQGSSSNKVTSISNHDASMEVDNIENESTTANCRDNLQMDQDSAVLEKIIQKKNKKHKKNKKKNTELLPIRKVGAINPMDANRSEQLKTILDSLSIRHDQSILQLQRARELKHDKELILHRLQAMGKYYMTGEQTSSLDAALPLRTKMIDLITCATTNHHTINPPPRIKPKTTPDENHPWIKATLLSKCCCPYQKKCKIRVQFHNESKSKAVQNIFLSFKSNPNATTSQSFKSSSTSMLTQQCLPGTVLELRGHISLEDLLSLSSSSSTFQVLIQVYYSIQEQQCTTTATSMSVDPKELLVFAPSSTVLEPLDSESQVLVFSEASSVLPHRIPNLNSAIGTIERSFSSDSFSKWHVRARDDQVLAILEEKLLKSFPSPRQYHEEPEEEIMEEDDDGGGAETIIMMQDPLSEKSIHAFEQLYNALEKELDFLHTKGLVLSDRSTTSAEHDFQQKLQEWYHVQACSDQAFSHWTQLMGQRKR